MKRFCLIIFVLMLCVVPVLSGCDKDYKSTDVISMYNTIVSDPVTKTYFKNNRFEVVYSEETINNSINDSSSPLYILGKVYRPIVTAASEMFVSQFTSPTFTTYINDFSQTAINSLYNGLEELSSKIKDFDVVKKAFETANSNSASGTFLSGLISEYNDLIDSLINLNSVFCAEYYSKVTLPLREINTSSTLASLDVTNEIMQTKNYIAQVVFELYVKNYTLSNPPTSIYSFINDSYCTYLKEALDCLNISYSSGSITSSKINTLKNYLIAMRNNYNSFISDKNATLSAIKAFNYKEFFSEPSKEQYIKDLSQTLQDNYNLTQNFLKTKFTARLNVLNNLINTFNA